MNIVQLDLPFLTGCDDSKLIAEAHCSRLTSNDIQNARGFVLHCANVIPNVDLQVDENTFSFTVFNGDYYQIMGLLGICDKPIDFHKYNIDDYSGNAKRIFHEIEYAVTDRRLVSESFLEHVFQIILMSVVDKEDDREEVLWFDYNDILYAKTLDKYHKQYGYYFVPESKYFAKKIVESTEIKTKRSNQILDKLK